jgi:hypothetical protein
MMWLWKFMTEGWGGGNSHAKSGDEFSGEPIGVLYGPPTLPAGWSPKKKNLPRVHSSSGYAQ